MADVEGENMEDELPPPEQVPGVTGVLTMTAGSEATPRKLRSIRLTGAVVTLGRGVANDVVLTTHLQISRKHCIFTRSGTTWHIQDFSTNGILVNTTKVSRISGTPLGEGDTIHMIPGGILVYNFRYINQPSVPLRLRGVPNLSPIAIPRLRRGVVNSPARRLESEVHNLNFGEDESRSSSSNSDMSESLLSLRTSPSASEDHDHEIDFEPPAPDPDPPVPAEIIDLDQSGPGPSRMGAVVIQDLHPTSEMTSRINLNLNLGGVPQASNSKRPIPVGPINLGKMTAKSPVKKRPKRQLASSLLVDIDSSDSNSDVEELLELDDDPVVLDRKAAARAKVSSNNPSGPSTSATALAALKNQATSSGSTSSNLSDLTVPKFSPSKSQASSTDLDSTSDVSVLRKQIKYFMDKCRETETEKKNLVLSLSMERESHANQLATAAFHAENHREELLRNLMEIMEHEFNCCICNEVFIQATVIDCGHTFCHFCISEWQKKKQECPVCRTKMTHMTKHVEMENFVVRMHGLMLDDVRTKRGLLLAERNRETAEIEAQQPQLIFPVPVRPVAVAPIDIPPVIAIDLPRGGRRARGRGRPRRNAANGQLIE